MTSWRTALAVTPLLLLAGCAARAPRPARVPERSFLPRIQYSVQVGAFADLDNALRLIGALGRQGIEAFYVVGDDGLHRVRFGSFGTKELATGRARALMAEQVIPDYYVVSPAPPGAAGDPDALRSRIVRSARSFLGRPYRWGGPSPETGFDCSGLTMTAYRLNGLALPRTAAEQYAKGASVSADGLQEADLVFFSADNGPKPTHVGLYLGGGRFIHAPSSGSVVRIDDLGDDYHERHFLAARSYLGGTASGAGTRD